uniref:Uncharacterized protein n=1 Tax=Trypanosoma vivax (strain Y486) TaxID=1055687 RepID=G0TZ67_TRYVY|nr:hypothetical protein, unlikely [Trypanosoma vivax Y486]
MMHATSCRRQPEYSGTCTLRPTASSLSVGRELTIVSQVLLYYHHYQLCYCYTTNRSMCAFFFLCVCVTAPHVQDSDWSSFLTRKCVSARSFSVIMRWAGSFCCFNNPQQFLSFLVTFLLLFFLSFLLNKYITIMVILTTKRRKRNEGRSSVCGLLVE